MDSFIRRIVESTIDMVFPPLCYSCFSHLEKAPISPDPELVEGEVEKWSVPTKEGTQQLNVCEKCASSIQVHSSLFCPVCKSRVPSSLSSSRSSSCHPKSDFLLAACSDFDIPAVRELIHTLKYRHIEEAIHPITELLIKPYIQHFNNWSNVNGQMSNVVIIPIPLHPSKKRQRGFNQSELIANALSVELSTFNFQLLTENALIRVKKTDSQAETKSVSERLSNVQGCFEVNGQMSIVNCRNIILVDDVTTSGATLAEAVKTLKQAGAKRVLAFTLAKA